MIGNLPTAFNPNNLGGLETQQVLGAPGKPEREYRVMFNQP